MIGKAILILTMVVTGRPGNPHPPGLGNVSQPIIYPMRDSQLKAAPSIFGPDYYERLRMIRQLNEERRRIPLDYQKR